MRAGALALVIALPACAFGALPPDGGAPIDAGAPGVVDAGDAGVGDAGERDAGASVRCPSGDLARVALDGSAGQRVEIVLAIPVGLRCAVEVTVPSETLVEVSAADTALSLDGRGEDEPGWLAPRPYEPGAHTVFVERASSSGDVSFVVLGHGPPVASIDEDRSLVWTQLDLVDDLAAVGLGRVMAAASEDGHGGRLLQAWLRRFSTTAHSERVGPTLLLEELEGAHGSDASAWDLDALPFAVTGVHNRIDLRSDKHCGELRVSFASTHATFRPLHLIFLFSQAPRANDRSPAGTLHCFETARAWARLSALEGDAFLDAARAVLDEGLVRARFLLAESEEFTIAPWEWRQWILVENPSVTGRELIPYVFDNPPLFQTVDTPRLNAPGALRDAFLAFVEANAADLDARRARIPESFRARSARVNAGVPWTPLDLTGVSDELLAAYPDLRRNIEIVGCPACHTADVEFVQTREDRTFSPFYTEELHARRDHLGALHRGVVEAAPFGPLQRDPVLPP